MPTAARRTTTKTDTTSDQSAASAPTSPANTSPAPGETRRSERATGRQPAAPSGAAARTGTATTQRPTGSALTYVAGAPVGPERATGRRPAVSSGMAARTGTTMPQRPAGAATSVPGGAPTTDQAAELAQQLARAAAEKVVTVGSGVVNTARTVVTLPVTATVAVVDDVVSAVRRPDVVLYGGALAGLAALGVLAWPVAGAVGLGVAVASGVRRARA
jgi:hypothetical protein